MRRRQFLKNVTATAAGALVAPYFLPSGRAFAASGVRRANHVVFCLFAGGVRNLESVQKIDGNLMPYTLTGTEPISPDIIGGMDALPMSTGSPLMSQGTLFKNFRYNQGPTGHYNGHTTAITGVYTSNDLQIKAPPKWPTIFEYYRKHNSPGATALNAWWISNQLGPYPALNFSSDPSYGAAYGANFMQPLSLISQSGFNSLGNPKTFDPDEAAYVNDIRQFLDNNFSQQFSVGDAGVINPPADAAQLESYIQNAFTEAVSGAYVDPWGVGGAMNNDMYNMFMAEEVIKTFQPELMVVNMQDVDACHSNFTQYANNLRKADYALAHLWETIQSTPGMANDTILIAAPEHGRNLTPNTLQDSFGRYALDHTGDEMSREIFCLVLGPPGVVVQGQEINSVEGESIDIVPTIANILGFDCDIPLAYRNEMGQALNQAFV